MKSTESKNLRHLNLQSTHSNIPFKMVYKGGGRLYIAALNDRYRENEES